MAADSARLKREKMLRKAVKDVRVRSGMKVSELMGSMAAIGGFSGQHLYNGIEITRAMLGDSRSFNFLSFPADIVSTGLRGVLAGMVKHFDAIITTGGMLDHDIARSFGGKYCVGEFDADDALLHRLGIYRLGNVFIEQKEYGGRVEDAFTEIMGKLYSSKGYKVEYSAAELASEFGKEIKDNGSILRQAYLNKVPVYNPGILDGAFGTQLTIFSQTHDFKLNLIKDELALSNISFDHKVTGALMLGGGISKHHVIWWSQFKGGLDYAVYVTTASQYDGSLSGARLTEAVSWGKVKQKARYTTIDGDITIILPIMFSYLELY